MITSHKVVWLGWCFLAAIVDPFAAGELDKPDLSQPARRRFSPAYERWLEAGSRPDVATMTERMMSLLTTMVPAGAPLPASRRKKLRAATPQAKSTALRTAVASRSKGRPRR